MDRRVARVAVGTFLSLLVAVAIFGQGAVSEVNGSVFDSSQALLPGVTITLVEETNGLTRSVVSNDRGRFVAIAVTPGRYTIKAELAGFQTQTRSGMTVAVGQALTINFSLRLAR